MKHIFNRLTVIIGLLAIFVGSAFATNSFLEETQNYSVTPKGNGVVHFKIPIWAYGAINNYRAGSPTMLWYSNQYVQSENEQAVTYFMSIRSTDTENTSDPKVNSTATVSVFSSQGTIKITKTANGGTRQVSPGETASVTLPAQKSMDGSYKRVVFLEFDWYLPENLTSKKFYAGMNYFIFKYDADDSDSQNKYKKIWYAFPDRMDGADDMMSPELQSPYLYFLDDNGTPARDGRAAVPFVVYQNPKSYTTSLNPSPVLINNRSGAIVVPTTDSIQKNFSATFMVQPNVDVSTTVERKTNPIDIPAFHRIHDFAAIEVQDEHDSYNGENKLLWNIHNPAVQDLIPTDYFEIQRAMKEDFSDAQTITLVQMEEDKDSYEYVDNTRVENGYATTNDSTTRYKEMVWRDYMLTNAKGDPMRLMNLQLLAKKVILPASPIYYRIRRASTAAWDWDHPFAHSLTLQKNNYLAPLADTQPQYTLDKDFKNNHLVHFNVNINNAPIAETSFLPEDCELKATFGELRGALDTVILTVDLDRRVFYAADSCTFRYPAAGYQYELQEGKNVLTIPVMDGEFGQINADVWVKLAAYTESFNGYTTDFAITTFTLNKETSSQIDGTKLEIRVTGGQRMSSNKVAYQGSAIRYPGGEGGSWGAKQAEARWDEIKNAVHQEMYDSLIRMPQTSEYGRCMWDRGAQLILMRTMQENQTTIELVVPQDSIRRNEDGSWTAHVTDVADLACTHYDYRVRIDQSGADLRFQYASSMLPIAIHGPELYFNEAATITSFTASQGDAKREWKGGVLLQWIPSSAAVDQYELLRLPKGSTSTPDTVYRGTESSYFDTSAVPGVHYEYTVVARYECKGKKTEDAKTTEGWRTPCGEISGFVHQTDNSGMAGVQVSLAAGSTTLKTLTTDASGYFRFDSLDYGAGTQYTVSVTSQYGEFSYNGTKSASAVIPLAADKCVQQDIIFVNTSCVRLTGRVLYHMSTIPVSGVCFILNGDTIRRGNAKYTSGIDGNFELTIPKSMPSRLQVAKEGHTFLNDGWLFVTEGDTTFSLVKPLDGVRFYDQTKVRLVGRVAGGIDQQALPPALGFGKNNLGDDLQLVLQLEGDNTAHIVHNPDDLSQDTIIYTIDNISGHTTTIFQQKRIIIRPDSMTGEYAVDLFPVKYKVTQATAKGYASLLDIQAGVPTFDLTDAPLTVLRADSADRHATFNARFDRIYRTPMQIGLKQYMYGMLQDGYGENKLVVSSFVNQSQTVALYEKKENGDISYLFGYPIFQQGRTYQFQAGVYEDYYYNNDKTNKPDRVRLNGGTLKTFNGFKKNTQTTTYPLDAKGEAIFNMEVDNLNLMATGTDALRSLDLSVGREGYSMDFHAVRGYVTGNVVEKGDIRTASADIKILDVLRDPPGSGSSCYLEKGATYKSSATLNIAIKFGVNLISKIGSVYDQSVGIVTGATYSGVSVSTGKAYSFPIPIVFTGKYSRTVTSTYTTSERISTSNSSAFIGANGDVFIGHDQEVMYGTVRAVRLIDDSTFILRRPAIDAGYIKEIASAQTEDGAKYHFVIAKETVLGGQMGNQFAYTQNYIATALLPKLIKERNALLVNATDTAEAQALANARGTAVYWNRAQTDDEIGTPKSYMMVIPKNVGDYTEPDRVEMFNNIILRWVDILQKNEKEKVAAIQSGKKVGTFSVSGGTSREYSETISADWTQGGNMAYGGINVANTAYQFNQGQGISTTKDTPYFKAIKDLLQKKNDNANGDNVDDAKKALEIEGKATGVSWKIDYEPCFDISGDGTTSSTSQTISRKIGFTIAPDSYANTTVSVYRAPVDSTFLKELKEALNIYIVPNPEIKQEYGTFIFFREAGTSHCPYEGEERTQWYFPGQFVIANATLPIENPKITLDQYTISNVPADQSAVFKITLVNDNVNTDGRVARGQYLSLSVDPTTNPNGAVLMIDGEPLTSSSTLTFFAEPGVPIVKTMQVQRGIVDDYEDITLKYSSTTCNSISAQTKFSVHFIPEASPVNVAYPRDKWVMNTLSPRDSTGYYLPISIDGFNIHHKSFDHIEFQYKLSTENNEAWVNQCSFYADDSLYNLATGNKAKIINGRIEPFRFYGERDPKELDYDLRAVSFCRYGSGFVTKASPVVSGTKDTRPPVLFGKALPANGILTLEDDIKLRFSEPIAGNWLDEDNNFQILGVTNATGITQTTSLYFDGNDGHYAASEALRELAITGLSVDMLIKPAEANREMTLFAHGNDEYSIAFILTADNRLKLFTNSDGKTREFLSKPMQPLSSTDFTRVIMVYSFDESTVRFYAGTQDITDDDYTSWLLQNEASPLMLGCGLEGEKPFHGNMMEVRIWTKALTPADIANTHMRRLTGYEYGLMDYYPMNENQGSKMLDLASGATLTAVGLSWTQPQGISLVANGAPVRLQPTLFSRTEAEDYTLMGWFRSNNNESDTISLFGTSMGDSVTMEIQLANGLLRYKAGDVDVAAMANLTDAKWHHCALVISKTFNTGSLYMDGELILSFPAINTGALSGTNVWLAKGLDGHIDDVCLFEQALSNELVREFGTQTPNGDEMGLINLLTFSQVKRNSSGVMELVYTPNNRRVFKDANGNTVNKEQPLLVDDLSAQADKNNSAPVRDRGQLTKLPFTWNYQLSDLLINIKSQPREINKRTMYLTVRDVEDLNGNRLPSPVMWSVYVDLNSIVWNERSQHIDITDTENSYKFSARIVNNTGMTRQYTVENLPKWMTVSPAQGTLEAKEEKTLSFTVQPELTVGLHHHIVYLTDDQGLAEPLLLEIEVTNECPWDEVDKGRFDQSMSIRGQVTLNTEKGATLDTSNDDIIAAFCDGEMVGQAFNSFDKNTNKSYVYLTVYGHAANANKPLSFKLWQASTGNVYNLTTERVIQYRENGIEGYAPQQPVAFFAYAGLSQLISVKQGWNWLSLNLKPVGNGILNTAMPAAQGWETGDMIKSSVSRTFAQFMLNDSIAKWQGPLNRWNYAQMYMVYANSAKPALTVDGTRLSSEERQLTIRKGWNSVACLLDQPTTVTEALGGYYSYATAGDLIKSKDAVAVFSENGKWEGSLTMLRPGEGYLMRRYGEGSVSFTLQQSSQSSNSPKKANANANANAFSNSAAATNMTMIAKVDDGQWTKDNGRLMVYVGGELAAVAEPIAIANANAETEPLYFITIQSDRVDELRFEMDGQELTPTPMPIAYEADSHLGSLKAPIVLKPTDNRPYKVLENQNVIIIRNGERYDITGKKLND